MSKGRALWLSFLAASCGCIASFSTTLLEQEWFADTAQKHPIIFKWAFIALMIWFQTRVIFGARPKRSAAQSMLHEHHQTKFQDTNEVRLSILVVTDYNRVRRFIWNLFRANLPRKYLRVTVRVPDDDVSPKVRFHRREGVAGVCWHRKTRWAVQDVPDFLNDQEAWVKFSKENLGISPKKAALLTRKCRSYVCAPIFEGTDTQEVRGILSADALTPELFSPQAMNELERLAKYLNHVPL